MTSPSSNAPRVNLTHRIEALSTALKNLQADPESAPKAKRLVKAIRSLSETRGLPDIIHAARRADEAAPGELVARIEDLLLAMRMEAGRRPASALPLLVVSTDPAIGNQIQSLFPSSDRNVVRSISSQEALKALQTTPVAAVFVDVVLAGQDGRSLILTLRSRPVSAAIPIIALLPKGAGGMMNDAPALGADATFEKPLDLQRIRDFLSVRLKRENEAARDARRDNLTGLLNRAAFCEAFDAAMARFPESGESMALGLLGIAGFEAFEHLGPVARDKVIQDVAAHLSLAFRSTDIIARWSVSEFIVLLPGEDLYGGERAIEKALTALNKQRIETAFGKTLPLIVCAGMVILSGNMEITEAAERAEHLLFTAYRMPKGKRDSISIATDEAQEPKRAERVGLCLSDPTMAKVLKPILERDGYKVDLLSEADEVHQKLLAQRYHLLIVDSDLPEGRSTDIVKTVRNLRVYDRLPIVMLVSNEQATEQAIELGATDYAVKPFAISSFMSRLRRILWQKGETGDNDQPTVLIVDHELPQLLVAGTALHQHGCKVFLARGSQDGLRRVSEVQPDWLILDINMPGTSAKDFLNTIPKLPVFRRMAILMAADWTQSVAEPSGHAFDIRGRLTRPFKPGTLLKEMIDASALKQGSTPEAPPDPAALQSEIARVMSIKP